MIQYSTSTAVNLALTVLVLFSLVTWALIFAKGWLQWRIRQENAGFTQRFWQAADLAGAEKIAGESSGALARLAKQGFATLRQMGERKTLADSGDRQAVMERSLSQQVRKEQHTLESGLMLLASIGSTAPFVGLFGTVWGIMNSFSHIAQSKNTSLAVVAPGISEALFATAIGLVAAIPAAAAYNILSGQVSRYAQQLEAFAGEFITILSRQLEEQV